MPCASNPGSPLSPGCCREAHKEPSPEKACVNPTPDPPCCKDKPSPCCDDSCIERIALRDCTQTRTLSPSNKIPESPHSDCQPSDGKPCDQHRRSARTRYADRLQALGCICRALIALGQESCCALPTTLVSATGRRSTESSRSVLRSSLGFDRERGKTGPERCSRPSARRGKKDACSSSCCSDSRTSAVRKISAATTTPDVGTSDTCSGEPETSAAAEQCACAKKSASPGTTNCAKGCCGKPPVSLASSPEPPLRFQYKGSGCGGCSQGCCGKPPVSLGSPTKVPLPSQMSSGSGSSKGCCGKSKHIHPAIQSPKENPGRGGCCAAGRCDAPALLSGAVTENKDPKEAVPTITPDLEKGITAKEHVVLSVSGMTCTGCETKLQRTLGTLQSVQNLKTSLMLSRAEFDLDLGVLSLEDLFKHLEKTTEFKYERITDQGSRADIIVPEASEFIKQAWPRGVIEMTVIDERTVNVAFDGKIIGARDLLEHGWDHPLCLAAPRSDPHLEAGNRHARHMGYLTALSILLTIPVLVLAWAPLPDRAIAYGSASLALATIVQVVIVGPFFPKALKALIFSRIIEMDLLIVLSTSAAYIFSVVSFGYMVAGKPLPTGQFFETGTLLVTLIMVGRYVAALARQKAVESISLRSLQIPTATLVDESGAFENEIDVRLLQYGDFFKVAPDSKIPTDGVVIGGSSEVDESMITGESIPVYKSLNSAVFAGSVNGSGTLTVRLTRLPAENTISIIAGMVDQAKLSKPKMQDIADRVASYFVPVVIILTIITFVIWIAIGIAVRNQSASRATTEAITYAITVLIVSCPCAIGLAVPMVIVIASGVAAERGIIFKAADSIEGAYKTSHVVFDKTGTLTRGNLTVKVEHLNAREDSMSLLLGLIGSNKHPISTAVAAHLKAQGVVASPVPNTKVLTGKGVDGSVPGLVLRAGNSEWLNLSSDTQVQSVLEKGYTAFCFTINDSVAAVFGLEDTLRPDAFETVTKLRKRGISVHLLSGDDDGPVRSIAGQLGIAAQNIRSRCTPADKQAYLQALAAPTPLSLSKRTQPPTTIFVGDGTNDAVALATATIGVHLNQESGSEVAKSAADVVLMRPSLLSVLNMIRISEKAVRRIQFNFGWSFVYNLFAVLLGAGAFVNARISPEFAGLGELVSVLPVVAAAVLLRWARV